MQFVQLLCFHYLFEFSVSPVPMHEPTTSENVFDNLDWNWNERTTFIQMGKTKTNQNKQSKQKKNARTQGDNHWMNCFHFHVCFCVWGGNSWPHEEKKEKVNIIWIIYSFIYFCEKKPKTTFCLVIWIRTRLWSLCEAILSNFFLMTLFLKNACALEVFI